MPNIRIGKQLEKSAAVGSIIITDANNEQSYVAPGAAGQTLTIVAGVPTWVDPTDEAQFVADITARDALTGLSNGAVITVEDASGDATVASGAALYSWDDANSVFVKLAEFESLDVASNTQASEDFTPATAATTVTIANTPAASTVVEVFRNGLKLPQAEWSIAAAVVTLTEAIGASTGGAGGETISVTYEF